MVVMSGKCVSGASSEYVNSEFVSVSGEWMSV